MKAKRIVEKLSSKGSGVLSFNATKEEKEAFMRVAKKLNYHNLSEWIRRTLMDRVEQIDKEE